MSNSALEAENATEATWLFSETPGVGLYEEASYVKLETMVARTK
ncbi:hypothetical protein [Methanosarcina sp. DH1]|nr:hypothetical protein [Methanosarcina sp. DH1]